MRKPLYNRYKPVMLFCINDLYVCAVILKKSANDREPFVASPFNRCHNNDLTMQAWYGWSEHGVCSKNFNTRRCVFLHCLDGLCLQGCDIHKQTAVFHFWGSFCDHFFSNVDRYRYNHDVAITNCMIKVGCELNTHALCYINTAAATPYNDFITMFFGKSGEPLPHLTCAADYQHFHGLYAPNASRTAFFITSTGGSTLFHIRNASAP